MSKLHVVTLIPGEGIGPEITEAAVRVVEASEVQVKWVRSWPTKPEFGNRLPFEILDSIKKNRVALKGPLGTPVGSGHSSMNIGLRQMFDLYANIRPVKSFAGVKSLRQDVDVVIFRENTEEFYTAEERRTEKGVELTAHLTRKGCERVIRAAFEYTRRHGRKRVTLAHKANILKMFYGYFLELGREIAARYPDIAFDDYIIDNFGQQLVMHPTKFDVVVLTNLMGDIMSDVAAGLVGGLGLAPGANIGDEYAIFEAVHGTAPDIAGKGIANPCAVILSAALMLQHIDEPEAANRIERAVAQVLKEGVCVTKDIHPATGVSTQKMTSAIIKAMAENN